MKKDLDEMLLVDYQNLCKMLKGKIKILEHNLENFESIQRGKCCECSNEAVQDLISLKVDLACFEDDYFKDLSFKEIAELAKKSLRVTADNINLNNLFNDIKEILENYKDLHCNKELSAEEVCVILIKDKIKHFEKK